MRTAFLTIALAAATPAGAAPIIQAIPITTTPGGPTTIDWSINLPPFGTYGTISVRWNAVGPSLYAGGDITGSLEFLYVDPDPSFPSYIDYATLSGTIVNRVNGFDASYSFVFPPQPYPSAPGAWYQNGSGYVSISAAWLEQFGPTSATAYITYNAAPIPEPGGWALLLSGFGLIGAGMRYRRQAPRVAFA